jgi:hypothetical protein
LLTRAGNHYNTNGRIVLGGLQCFSHANPNRAVYRVARFGAVQRYDHYVLMVFHQHGLGRVFIRHASTLSSGKQSFFEKKVQKAFVLLGSDSQGRVFCFFLQKRRPCLPT